MTSCCSNWKHCALALLHCQPIWGECEWILWELTNWQFISRAVTPCGDVETETWRKITCIPTRVTVTGTWMKSTFYRILSITVHPSIIIAHQQHDLSQCDRAIFCCYNILIIIKSNPLTQIQSYDWKRWGEANEFADLIICKPSQK